MNRSPLHWLTSDISQWDPDICHKISWKTSQASRLYSLVTEVDQPGICGDIWNHHSVSSIVHILWAAKCTHHKKGQMVCCWKGMENLQCGSQNHHVCHTAWLKVKGNTCAFQPFTGYDVIFGQQQSSNIDFQNMGKILHLITANTIDFISWALTILLTMHFHTRKINQ